MCFINANENILCSTGCEARVANTARICLRKASQDISLFFSKKRNLRLAHGLSPRMICMILAWSVWGKNMLRLPLRAMSVSTVSYVPLRCSARGSLSFKRGEPLWPRWNACWAGWETRDGSFPFSCALTRLKCPHACSWSTLQHFFRASWGCGFSCLWGNDKAYKELLEVVTRAVARLQLD